MVLQHAPAQRSRSRCPLVGRHRTRVVAEVGRLARGGTSFSGGLAGGSGWSGEGVIVGGAGGATGEPSGSTGSTGCNGTGCNGEGVGEKEMSFVREEVEALPL